MSNKSWGLIREPRNDSVVYISRREEGLVPLSTLCKEGKSRCMLSSNVHLLEGRNSRLGKPISFVKDEKEDRLLAIGGSRQKEVVEDALDIIKVSYEL